MSTTLELHNFTPTTLVTAMYPGVVMEMKNPKNYPANTPIKRYKTVRDILEIHDPTTQCNNTIGPLQTCSTCWLCGAPIFLQDSGMPMFKPDVCKVAGRNERKLNGSSVVIKKGGKPTYVTNKKNFRELNSECEHIVPILAAWWILGGLYSSQGPAVRPELLDHEYRYSHHFCNHLKSSILFFDREGNPDIDIINSFLRKIWDSVPTIQRYQTRFRGEASYVGYERSHTGFTSDMKFKTRDLFIKNQTSIIIETMGPLIAAYKEMLGATNRLETFAVMANLAQHIETLVHTVSNPLRKILIQGLKFKDPEAATPTLSYASTEHTEGMLSNEKARELTDAYMENMKKETNLAISCNEKSPLLQPLINLYGNRGLRASFLFPFLNCLLNPEVTVTSFTPSTISLHFCNYLQKESYKVMPLILNVINNDGIFERETLVDLNRQQKVGLGENLRLRNTSSLQKEAIFLERLELELYNNLLNGILSCVSSTEQRDINIKRLLEFIRGRINILQSLSELPMNVWNHKSTYVNTDAKKLIKEIDTDKQIAVNEFQRKSGSGSAEEHAANLLTRFKTHQIGKINNTISDDEAIKYTNPNEAEEIEEELDQEPEIETQGSGGVVGYGGGRKRKKKNRKTRKITRKKNKRKRNKSRKKK